MFSLVKWKTKLKVSEIFPTSVSPPPHPAQGISVSSSKTLYSSPFELAANLYRGLLSHIPTNRMLLRKKWIWQTSTHLLWPNVPRSLKLKECVSQHWEASSVSQMGQGPHEEVQPQTPILFYKWPQLPNSSLCNKGSRCFLKPLPGSPTFPELVHSRNTVWQVRTWAT